MIFNKVCCVCTFCDKFWKTKSTCARNQFPCTSKNKLGTDNKTSVWYDLSELMDSDVMDKRIRDSSSHSKQRKAQI